MWRQVLAPVHPDGWKFVAIAAGATIILFLLWWPLGWVGLIATLWIAYFFRDPWRVTPARPGPGTPSHGCGEAGGPSVLR